MRSLLSMNVIAPVPLVLPGAASPEPAAHGGEEEGFVPLANGRDLADWTGNTGNCHSKDGPLVAEPQASRYTGGLYAHPG